MMVKIKGAAKNPKVAIEYDHFTFDDFSSPTKELLEESASELGVLFKLNQLKNVSKKGGNKWKHCRKNKFNLFSFSE